MCRSDWKCKYVNSKYIITAVTLPPFLWSINLLHCCHVTWRDNSCQVIVMSYSSKIVRLLLCIDSCCDVLPYSVWPLTPDHCSQPEILTLWVIYIQVTHFIWYLLLLRFVVLRCRVEMIISEARKMVYSIEEQLTMRPVRFILVQRCVCLLLPPHAVILNHIQCFLSKLLVTHTVSTALTWMAM